MPDLDPTPSELDAIARSARRKVALRILPLLFVMYVIAYLDRANLGFVKARMTEDLQFSDTVYGWGVALFFIGYIFLEVPGALFVEHWSARKWFTRILITWGFCSMAMALVRTPAEFYAVRFLLGLAEAGFFPGVIVYFTHWYPRRERSRAMSAMLIGVPLSLALGAPISALLLKAHWFDLKGWQWVFIVEGAPAVLLGLALPWLLPDRPRQAKWLTPQERDWLEDALEADRRASSGGATVTLRQALKMRNVWLLALALLATNIGGYVFIYWLKGVVEGLLASTGRNSGETAALLWTGGIFLCGVAGVVVSGWSSDRRGERRWHCITGQLGGAVFLVASSIPGQPWELVFAWLCLCGFFAMFWFSPFWALPTMTLTSSAAAVSIAVINMCGNVAGAIGSPVVGVIKDAGGAHAAEALVVVSFTVGAVFVAMVRVPPRTNPEK